MSSPQGKYGCRANIMTGFSLQAPCQQRGRVGERKQRKIAGRFLSPTDGSCRHQVNIYSPLKKTKKKNGSQSQADSVAGNGSILELERKVLWRLNDDNCSSPTLMSLKIHPNYTGELYLALTLCFLNPILPLLFLNARTPSMCTHVTHGSVHRGDTCERNLHFQLNCWPSLQNATLDSAPSSPGLLLLPRQPSMRRNERLFTSRWWETLKSAKRLAYLLVF